MDFYNLVISSLFNILILIIIEGIIYFNILTLIFDNIINNQLDSALSVFMEEKVLLMELDDYEYLDTELQTDELYCLLVTDSPNILLRKDFVVGLRNLPSLKKFKA